KGVIDVVQYLVFCLYYLYFGEIRVENNLDVYKIKKSSRVVEFLVLALTLVACGQNSSDERSNNDNAGMGNNEDQTNNMDDQNEDRSTNDDNTTDHSDDMARKMDELDYKDFELEVDYGSNQEFEAELEQSDPIKAELDDEMSDIDVSGDEAFNILYPIIKKLSIDRNTSKEDAIEETLTAFDLPSDYEKFELELTFEDETKIEFED